MIYFTNLIDVETHRWNTILLDWAKDTYYTARDNNSWLQDEFFRNITGSGDRPLIRKCMKLAKEHLQFTIKEYRRVKGEYEIHLEKKSKSKEGRKGMVSQGY